MGPKVVNQRPGKPATSDSRFPVPASGFAKRPRSRSDSIAVRAPVGGSAHYCRAFHAGLYPAIPPPYTGIRQERLPGGLLMKKLSFIQRNNQRHWVGDGFPVRSVFSYHDRGTELSPFLLLDYAGPTTFPPSRE